MTTDRTAQFRALHESGTFVMPNPWDVGSARILASLGFPALATTSSGHAATFGRLDQHVTRDELLAHAEAVAAAVDVPLNVDAEGCFADDPGGVARTVELIGQTGAAGCSFEDYDPAVAGHPPDRRGRRAGGGGRRGGPGQRPGPDRPGREPPLRPSRPRRHHRPPPGLRRRRAPTSSTRPGWPAWRTSRRVVAAVDRPVNVLALPRGPSVPELASVDVRRISTGGLLARAAYGALDDRRDRAPRRRHVDLLRPRHLERRRRRRLRRLRRASRRVEGDHFGQVAQRRSTREPARASMASRASRTRSSRKRAPMTWTPAGSPSTRSMGTTPAGSPRKLTP